MAGCMPTGLALSPSHILLSLSDRDGITHQHIAFSTPQYALFQSVGQEISLIEQERFIAYNHEEISRNIF